jgi:hypothetical protein
MSGDWRGTLWTLLVTFCIVIIRCIETFWSPCIHISIWQNSTHPDAGCPDRLGPSGKFVENSTKLTWLEITCYQIKYSAFLWLLELKIRLVRRFRFRYILWMVTAELQTANVFHFQRTIRLSGFSAYPDGSPSQLIRVSGVLLHL